MFDIIRTSNLANVAAMYQHPATRPLHIGGVMMAKIVSGIYEIRNTTNGHRYIGSSVNIKQRWTDHKKRLKRGDHHCSHLQNAWNKYGRRVFVFTLIETVVDTGMLIEREQYYLDTIRPEYNTLKQAGSSLGFKQPPHVGLAVAKANSERIHSKETRRKLATNKGVKFTKEHRGKISKAKTLFYLGGGKNGNERAIEQYSIDGVFVRKYEKISDAARINSLKGTHICRCARGKRKSVGGFIWRYSEERQ